MQSVHIFHVLVTQSDMEYLGLESPITVRELWPHCALALLCGPRNFLVYSRVFTNEISRIYYGGGVLTVMVSVVSNNV